MDLQLSLKNSILISQKTPTCMLHFYLVNVIELETFLPFHVVELPSLSATNIQVKVNTKYIC